MCGFFQFFFFFISNYTVPRAKAKRAACVRSRSHTDARKERGWHGTDT